MSDPTSKLTAEAQSPQPLDYCNPLAAPKRSRSRGLRYALLPFLIPLVLAILVYPVVFRRPRVSPEAALVYCEVHLHQLYEGMFTYAQSNGGAYPDGIADLVEIVGYSNRSAFACVEARDTPAPGPTTQALRQQLAAGGHLSYLYLAKGLTTKASADTVLALDASPCHLDGTTVNILFADGHVESRPRAQWMTILTQLASGIRPVRDPATQPTTVPASTR